MGITILKNNTSNFILCKRNNDYFNRSLIQQTTFNSCISKRGNRYKYKIKFPFIYPSPCFKNQLSSKTALHFSLYESVVFLPKDAGFVVWQLQKGRAVTCASRLIKYSRGSSGAVVQPL